jgi:hypothetical protein
MTSPVPIASASPGARRPRTPHPGTLHRQDGPWDREYGRDVWRLSELGIHDRGIANISFTDIPQPWLKDLAKRWARWRLATGRSAEAGQAADCR